MSLNTETWEAPGYCDYARSVRSGHQAIISTLSLRHRFSFGLVWQTFVILLGEVHARPSLGSALHARHLTMSIQKNALTWF